MKLRGFGFLLFVCLQLSAQDKIYLLDGQRLDGKISEMSAEKIKYEMDSASYEIAVKRVLLIEFSNGSTRIFQSPERNVYRPANLGPKKKSVEPEIHFQNEIYLNTLSLFNADVSLYYEYRLRLKKIGLGFMGTYNFNRSATVPNAFIAVLSNAKKQYDAGAFMNLYSGIANSNLSLFMGLQLKYTAFQFMAAKEDSVYTNNQLSVNISYTPANSSQFSTLLNAGIHADITETLFLKSSFAFGFFFLNKLYKDQINYALKDPQSGSYPNYSFLPKASLCIAAGIKF